MPSNEGKTRQASPAILNDRPGVTGGGAALSPGALVNVLAFDIADDRIQAVRSIVNPDKLKYLGPVADLATRLGAES
jgi:hypothetical protein